MKRYLKVFMVVALGAIICLPGVAAADYTLSSINLVDNYPQAWLGSGTPIDLIEAYISDGPAMFADPGILAVAGWGLTGYFSGWTGQKISDAFARATTETPSGTVVFDYKFTGSIAYPFTIDVNFFSGDTFILHETLTVGASGNHIQFDAYNTTQYFPPDQIMGIAAPLPPSLLLLGTGLVGLGFLRRRKVKDSLAA